MEERIVPASEADAEGVHTGLKAYNAGFCGDVQDLSFAIRDDKGTCIAGTDTFRIGELILVDVLWVAESRRGQGLGQRLLSHVEEEGRRQGARRVELNTFGFQAPGFYEKLGYRLIGKVEPSVRAYGHYYYEKDLKALFPTWKQGFDAHH